jgi:hypothetical protein
MSGPEQRGSGQSNRLPRFIGPTEGPDRENRGVSLPTSLIKI